MSARESFDAPLQVTVRQTGNHNIVSLSGAAGMDELPVLEREFEALRTRAGAHLILDFTDLVFISSPGIGAIVNAHRHARERHGSLRIAGANANVERLLKLMHIDQIIPLHATLGEAEAALK